MTSKANLPLVLKGATPQQFFCPCLAGSAMNLMTGQTPDLTLVEGEGVVCGISRLRIDGMMVFFVVMTAKTRV
jgi:hypothetical protein